jgi:hypothetical protein
LVFGAFCVFPDFAACYLLRCISVFLAALYTLARLGSFLFRARSVLPGACYLLLRVICRVVAWYPRASCLQSSVGVDTNIWILKYPTSTTARGRSMRICTISRGECPFLPFSHLCISLSYKIQSIHIKNSNMRAKSNTDTPKRTRYTLVPSPCTTCLLREKGWGNLRVGRGVDGGVFSVSCCRVLASFLLPSSTRALPCLRCTPHDAR